MAQDYLIPLGIDGEKIISGLNDTIGAIGKVEVASDKAGKSIEDAFGKGAKAADSMENALKPTAKSIEDLRKISSIAGKELSAAFDIRKSSSEFTKNIESFKKQLKEVTAKKTIGLEVDASTIKDLKDATKYLKDNFDDITSTFTAATGLLGSSIDDVKAGIKETEIFIKDLEKSLKTTAPGMVEVGMVEKLNGAKQALAEGKFELADYEASLKEVNEANKNLAKTLKDATVATDQLEASQNGGESTAVRMTLELRKTKDAISQMAQEGKAGSASFEDMTQKAAGLKNQINKTNAEIKTFGSNTKYIDATVSGVTGLVGAFALAQGATALLGEENEDLMKALVKVNGAMAVLQGLQAVADTLNKNSAFSIIFLRKAKMADVVATEAQTVATTAQTVTTRVATVATKAFGFALKALGIGLIIGLIAYLVENWDNLKDSLNKLLPVGFSIGKMFNQIKSIAVGVGNAVLQYLVTPFKAVTALLTGNIGEFKNAIREGANFKKNFQEGYNKQELRNEKAHQKELEKARIDADARDLERRKNRGENVTKQEQELQKRRVALQEKGSTEYKDGLKELEDMEDQSYKTRKDEQKKASEDAKKVRDEAQKKRLEDEKKNSEQVLKFSRALSDARIAGIEDDLERERAIINEDFKRRLEDLKKEGAQSQKAMEQMAELEVVLIEERDKKIREAEELSAKEKLKAKLDFQQSFEDLQKEGTERDLKLLQIDHEKRKADIEEQYKDESDLKAKLLLALDESTARERKNITDEAFERSLKDEEEKQLLVIELSSQYAKKSEETERQKQLAIYATKIEFAGKAIDLLTASGADENSLEILRARKNLKDLKDGLNEELKKGSGQKFDFLKFLGIDAGDDQGLLKESIGDIYKNLGEITDFVVDQYQRQIDKKQEVIDHIDNDISGLEDKLDKEKQLREDGFANNVEIIEQELAAKQAEKDEEIKQQEALFKKKQELQKAQMAVDTAIQLVNLVTASTEIFKALAGIPFIGIPLAIGTIGTMFGSFTAAKIKAAQAISSQKFGEGGWIDGKSHSEGGKKYYSPDGDVRELEKDEFVVRKKQAKKFSNLLEAINNGSFTGFNLNDSALGEVLAGMGISMAETSSKAGLKEANERANIVIHTGGNNKSMDEMNENIRYLAQQERERTKSWEDDKYIYNQKGSRVIRILKVKKEEEQN